MNWYSVFYWITVADGVKSFFDVFSNIFTTLAILSLIIYVIMMAIKASGDEDDIESVNFWITRFARFFWFSATLMVLTWAGYVFTPSKKDAVIIVAGGSVGKFLANDSSAKALPAELTNLLRSKVRELSMPSAKEVQDTLVNKSKEELIEMLHEKQAK